MKFLNSFKGTDYLKLLAMVIYTVFAGGLALFFLGKSSVNMTLLLCYIILFSAGFLFVIEYEYIIEESAVDIHRALSQIMITYLILFTLNILTVFLPVRVSLVLASAYIFSVYASAAAGLMLASFMGLSVVILTDASLNYMVGIIFLSIIGSIARKGFKQKQYRVFFIIPMFILSVAVYLTTYVADVSILDYKAIIIAFIEAIVNSIVIMIIMSFDKKVIENDELLGDYGRTLEEDFPLVLFVRQLGDERFIHSRSVAKISYKAAKAIGLDEKLCSSAGFYYSLCDNDEKDPVEYAVDVGLRAGLPIEVLRLLKEYQALKNPISRRETALVDLVDTAVGDVMEADKKGINDKVEYTLIVSAAFDRLSKTGRYDECGLSMNQFLKIRDIVINEVEK